MKGKKALSLILFILMIFYASAASAQYDTDRFLYRGQRQLSEGKYARAIENFNILLRLDPKMYDAYFLRGIAKYNLEDFMGAMSDFNRALELNPIYTPAYHYRSIVHSRVGNFDAALQDLAKAVDLRPSYNGLYFSRGITYFLSQQFEKAVEDFNVFLKRDPEVPDAYLNRGAAYLYLRDTVSAMRDYNEAIRLNVMDPEGYIRRARILIQLDSLDEAMADLNQALNLDDLNTYAYFNRALLHYERHDYASALEDLGTLIDIDPTNSLAIYNRALILSQIGDLNHALDDYDRVLYINPRNVLAYFNRAAVFLELNLFEEAIEDYTEAISLYPDFAKAYMNRSYARQRLGQLNAAREDYRTAQRKIKEFNLANLQGGSPSFSDTTAAFSKLLAFDADFAKSQFSNDEMLQNRTISVSLKPFYKFLPDEENVIEMALSSEYESADFDRFRKSSPIPLMFGTVIPEEKQVPLGTYMEKVENVMTGLYPKGMREFVHGILFTQSKQFNAATESYDAAILSDSTQAYYYLNRGVVRAEVIEFMSSVDDNVTTLTMDNSGNTRARVKDRGVRQSDYQSAIDDILKAIELRPDFPYSYYNLANLYSKSGKYPEAIEQYTRAISLYPLLGEAYYNRGMVSIYLKDKEKGCLDMSKAGELGILDAYPVIKKYCEMD